MSARDENRHLDVKREVNYRMSGLIDRYLTHYGNKKLSADREKSILEGIRSELGRSFVREVDGVAVQRWYENLTKVRGLSDGTAVRHFKVMHHLMEKASTIWSMETGIDRNPADQVEVRRPDDSRDRYLSGGASQTQTSARTKEVSERYKGAKACLICVIHQLPPSVSEMPTIRQLASISFVDE